MKKGCLITLCIVGGLIALVFIYLFVVFPVTHALSHDNKDIDNTSIQFFDEPGDKMDVQTYKVEKALSDSTALARADDPTKLSYYNLTVLLYSKSGVPYYDAQIVKAYNDKIFRQVGVYKYTEYTENKTVPIVELLPVK